MEQSQSLSSSNLPLLQALLLATGNTAASTSQADSLFSSWEAQPEFWSILLEAAFQRDLANQLPQFVGHNEFGLDPIHSNQQQLEQRAVGMRTIAIIRFKNGVNKYWRTRIVAVIPKETKDNIRQLLFRCLDEPDRTIALQSCVSIAKIARHDYPSTWPTLFSDLQSFMSSAHAELANLGPAPTDGSSESPERGAKRTRNTLILMRAADVTSRTLKELESAKMLAGKIRMAELARSLLPTLQPIFAQYFSETFPEALQSSPEALSQWATSPLRAEEIRTSHLLLKAITKLAVADLGTISSRSGVPSLGTGANPNGEGSNFAQAFFRSTPPLLQTITNIRSHFLRMINSSTQNNQSGNGILQDPRIRNAISALTKHVTSFGKLFLGLIERDKSKAASWEGWSEVLWWYWAQTREVSLESLSASASAESTGGMVAGALLEHPSKFIVQSLLLLKDSLNTWKTNQAIIPEVFKSQDFIQDAVEVLVGKLMRLTNEDLRSWSEDSEAFSVNQEISDSTFETEIRPAAERTLMVLAQYSKPDRIVGKILWSKFLEMGNSNSGGGEESLESLLNREALYSALGRCRDYLPVADLDSGEVGANLGEMTGSRLVREASLDYPAGSSWLIIRRRICLLLYSWSESVNPASRPAIYQLLVSLLESISGKTDFAVRLVAAKTLADLADAIQFDPEVFEPFLPMCLSRLTSLATDDELNEMDSIKTCTDALSIIIERVGPRVGPHVSKLAALVPDLWMNEDRENKAKPSIITMVMKLVMAVGTIGEEKLKEGIQNEGEDVRIQLHSIVEPIVKQSLTTDLAPLLGKDALTLWAKALRSSPYMTAPLFSLMELVPQLLQQPDFSPEACQVLEETVSMVPKETLQHYGFVFFQAMANIIADSRSPMVLSPLGSLDLIFQSMYKAGCAGEVWPELMLSSGLFAALLGNLLFGEEAVIIETYFVLTLSRLLLASPPAAFGHLLRSSLPRLAELQAQQPTSQPRFELSASAIYSQLISLFVTRFENMSTSKKRKVVAVGLASLLAKADPNFEDEREIYKGVPEMASIWSAVFAEIKDGEDGGYRALSPVNSLGGGDIGSDDGWLEDITPGAARAAALADEDPVKTIPMNSFVSQALNEAQSKGGQFFESVLTNMDQLVLSILKEDLSRG